MTKWLLTDDSLVAEYLVPVRKVSSNLGRIISEIIKVSLCLPCSIGIGLIYYVAVLMCDYCACMAFVSQLETLNALGLLFAESTLITLQIGT